MNEYGTSDGYGGLAGFGGPALDAGDAPVVRYQDLHRRHAPASAGAPSVGFGDVAMSAPEGMYGDVALVEGAQQAAPTYGGMGAMRPLYGGGYGASVGLGNSGEPVKKVQDALVVLGLLRLGTYEPGKFDKTTEDAAKTFLTNEKRTVGDGSLNDADQSILFQRAEEKKAAATKKGKKDTNSDEDDSWFDRTLRSVSSGVQEVGKGVVRGTAKQVGVSRFEESGMDSKPVSGKVDKKDERPEWQTYAIWGGAAVAGVSLAYLLYRAYSKSEKKGGA